MAELRKGRFPKGYVQSEELYCYIEQAKFDNYNSTTHRQAVIRARIKFNNIWNLCKNDNFDADNKF